MLQFIVPTAPLGRTSGAHAQPAIGRARGGQADRAGRDGGRAAHQLHARGGAAGAAAVHSDRAGCGPGDHGADSGAEESEAGAVAGLPPCLTARPPVAEWLPVRLKRSVRIECAPDRQINLLHSGSGERPRQPLSKQGLLQGRDEVSSQVGRPGKACLARIESQGGRALGSLASERNDENRIDPFTQVPRIERNHEHPVANRRITQVGSPDFATSRRDVRVGQNRSLRRRR